VSSSLYSVPFLAICRGFSVRATSPGTRETGGEREGKGEGGNALGFVLIASSFVSAVYVIDAATLCPHARRGGRGKAEKAPLCSSYHLPFRRAIADGLRFRP